MTFLIDRTTAHCLGILPVLAALFSGVECARALTWVSTTAPVQPWTSVASSSNGVKLVAVNHNGGIYASADSGQQWVATSAPNQPWNSVAISANGARSVAVGESGIVFTSNSGASWNAATVPGDASDAGWVSVAASADGSEWVAAAHDRIFVSTNSGATWASTTAPTNQWSSVACSKDGVKLAAAADPGSIYLSGDSGASWTTSNVPILAWSSLASSADGSQLVAAATLGGIYISTNSGVTWIQTDAPTDEVWCSVASSSDGTKLIAAGFYGGIYTSADSGVTWVKSWAPSSTWYSVCLSAPGDKPAAAAFNGGIYVPVVSTGATKGVYQGLFYDTNGVVEDSSGFFSASTTANGTFSAKLQFAGKSYSFSGRFPVSGSSSNASATDAVPSATNTIPRKGSPSLSVVLKSEAGGDEIDGSVSDGVWTAELAANRAVYSAKYPPQEAGNKYTFVFPGSDDSSMEMGAGFGTVSVDRSGNVALQGTLADGSKIAQKRFLSLQSQWPLFASLYSGKGSLLGWLTFADDPLTDIDGLIDWIKPAQPRAKYYPSGFTNEAQPLGSRYQFTNGYSVLNLTAGQLRLADSNLLGGFTNRITIGSDNTIRNLSSNQLTLTLMTASGLFRGTVAHPVTELKIPLYGAVLQKQNIGLGFFLGDSQSGSIFLESGP